MSETPNEVRALMELATAHEEHLDLFERTRDAQLVRRAALRDAVAAGCSVEDIADAVGMTPKAAEVEVVLRRRELERAA